jgi:D-alanyl-D-alanine carboxypeptidase
MPSLRTLDPSFRPAAEAFFGWARARWPGLVVTSARRTHFEQLRLYQASLAGNNGGLPALPPGHSDHELGLAWDMARPGKDPFTDPALREAGAAWASLGHRWWAGDPVHFSAGWGRGPRGGRARKRTRRSTRSIHHR